jgi:hypothetical protein
MLRPYGSFGRRDPDDAMDVVGHDDECVEADGREAAGKVSPSVRHDLPDQPIVE